MLLKLLVLEISQRTYRVLLVGSGSPSIVVFLVTQHTAIQWGFLFLFGLLKITPKTYESSDATCLFHLFFSFFFACSTFFERVNPGVS